MSGRISAMVGDGMRNLLSRLGTAADKREASEYVGSTLTAHQLRDAYRTSWIPKKLVNIPAQDATRRWRSWQADKDDISKIEAVEKALGLRKKAKTNLRGSRLYGGCAILIGADDGQEVDQPLNVERIGLGGLKFLTVLSRQNLSPDPIVLVPESPYFGRPEHYTLAWATGASVRVHASRLSLLFGEDDPGALTIGTHGWGDSILQAVYSSFRDTDAAVANVAAMVFEAKTDTIGIPNLTALLTQDPRAEQAVLDRLSMAERAKSIIGATVHDTSEMLGQKQLNFSGLPDVLDRFFQICAGAADIPMTRFFGQSPGGLNSNGDSDLRNYYDLIEDMQETVLGDSMTILDEVLIRSALGARPDDVHYNWRPLWQTSDKDLAEIGKNIAETAVKLEKVLPPEVLTDAVANTIIELGAMPGLEAAIEEYGLEFEDATDDERDAATMAGEDGAPVTDAAPRTLYVRRDVVNSAEIKKWARDQGFESVVDDLHVTIAYSKARVDWMAVGESWSDEVEVPKGGPRLVEKLGDATTILFASAMLKWRHNDFVRAGASWDFPEYQPHITITYGDAPENVEPYTGLIKLGPEIFEEVRENAKEEITET